MWLQGSGLEAEHKLDITMNMYDYNWHLTLADFVHLSRSTDGWRLWYLVTKILRITTTKRKFIQHFQNNSKFSRIWEGLRWTITVRLRLLTSGLSIYEYSTDNKHFRSRLRTCGVKHGPTYKFTYLIDDNHVRVCDTQASIPDNYCCTSLSHHFRKKTIETQRYTNFTLITVPRQDVCVDNRIIFRTASP